MKKIIRNNALCALALCCANALNAQQSVSLENLSGEKGSTINLSVVFNTGGIDIQDFQCDIVLPGSVVVGTPELTEATHEFDIRHNQLKADTYRVIMFDMDRTAYVNGEIALFTVPVTLDAEVGEYPVKVTGVVFTENNTTVSLTCPEHDCTLTIIPEEVKRYGMNQLYVKDITITEGEDATMLIGYNSDSDVYEYSADIALPSSVSVASVTFNEVVASVANFTNDYNVASSVLTVAGEYGGGRKDLPADGGDNIFAVAQIVTSTLAAGEYDIVVSNQKLFNDDDIWPADYTAKLVVVAKPSAEIKKCASPVIDFDKNGKLIISCATEGAMIHTSISSDDIDTFHHVSEEPIELSGRYLINTYATAEGYEDSDSSTATIVWVKSSDESSGNDHINVDTEEILLLSSAGDTIVIKGTVKDEPVAVYSISGYLIYQGNASENEFVIPVSLPKDSLYIINIRNKSIKYLL